jgi:hypothetical protein
MIACVEVLPWERQPREGEQAYAAFLAYRDLGPRRTLEATRQRLGKRPGYLKPIERWSALRDWRRRSCAWDDHLQAERDRVAAEEAAKWERRRLQALEEGWQLCQTLRARLAEMLAFTLEAPAAAPPEPAEATPEAVPEAVATPEKARPTAGRGPTRWDYTTVTRLSKLIVELEWALLNETLPPPGKFDPLTATDEQIKAYLVLHPRVGRSPPR